MKSRAIKILAIAVAVIVAIAAGGYLSLDGDMKGLVRYYLWKISSRDSGSGRYATVNGISMYYEIHGRGEPLLLLHGGTAFIESFFRQIPALAEKFMVIAPDSRGHGRTADSEKPLSYALMASDAAELLEKLEIKNAFVVGWSDGGIIGLHLAMHRPELVRKLVVIGANYHYNGLTPEFHDMAVKMSPESPEMKETGDFYRMFAPDPKHWPVIVKKIRAMWLSEPDYSAAALGRITCPVLVIAGEHDAIRTEHTREMARLIPRARLEIVPGASHKVPMEKPGAVNAAIVSFLGR
jgi:pimeloyl-ACP methyl ester carboxylesterase